MGVKFQNSLVSVYKNAFLCSVSIEATPSEAVATGDVVISGLPGAACDMFLNLPTTNGNSYSAYLNKSGTLMIYYPAFTEIGRIDTCFMYPIAQ